MRFGDLTSPEVREHATSGWLAVVPTGCTEQQGPHLPVDFDTWFAETICLASTAATHGQPAVKALVLPALPFGPTPEHRNFGSGYIHLPQEVHESVVASVLDSLAEQGFKRIVIWRGCGQHNLIVAVEHFNTDHLGTSHAFQPALPYHEIWCRIGDPSLPSGHADAFATSIALHLRPEAVRKALISNPHSTPVDWHDPNLDLSRYSATGVIGDPTHASAELGERLWLASIDRVRSILLDISLRPLG